MAWLLWAVALTLAITGLSIFGLKSMVGLGTVAILALTFLVSVFESYRESGLARTTFGTLLFAIVIASSLWLTDEIGWAAGWIPIALGLYGWSWIRPVGPTSGAVDADRVVGLGGIDADDGGGDG
jgi:hypothetical protein